MSAEACERPYHNWWQDGDVWRCHWCDHTMPVEVEHMSEPSQPAPGRNGRWEKLGQVGVDSASIGITDLLIGVQDSRCRTASEGANAGYATPGSEWAGDWGTGIRFWAGFGDGGYDVWGWIVDYGEDGECDERVAQVVITMIDDAELAAWRGAAVSGESKGLKQ